MGLKNKTIILGITGGIAAYKACELARLLVKDGASVHVILTESARHFVTELTLQTLTKNPVHTQMFGLLDPGKPLGENNSVEHISLADRADMVIVAPASANIIGKVAGGICDDLLSTTICATKATVVFAPSMNVNMWENKIVQDNIKKLRKLGYKFIEPEKGELACGYSGVGRLAEPKSIADFLSKACKGS